MATAAILLHASRPRRLTTLAVLTSYITPSQNEFSTEKKNHTLRKINPELFVLFVFNKSPDFASVAIQPADMHKTWSPRLRMELQPPPHSTSTIIFCCGREKEEPHCQQRNTLPKKGALISACERTKGTWAQTMESET